MISPLIRRSVNAGSAYEPDPQKLSSEISLYLSNAKARGTLPPPRVIIGPHGSYYDCGPTLAQAYSLVDPARISRVFIFGLSHLKYFTGCALTNFEKFECPFGYLQVDLETLAQLKTRAQFTTIPEDFEEEDRSMEMHLPFIARVFRGKALSIVPVYVGPMMDFERTKYAALFSEYLADPKTLFVCSADLVHWGDRFEFNYHNEALGEIYRTVEHLDGTLLNLFQEGKLKELLQFFEQSEVKVCGKNVLALMLETTTLRGLETRVLKYSMSRRVRNKEEWSISYAAMACCQADK